MVTHQNRKCSNRRRGSRPRGGRLLYPGNGCKFGPTWPQLLQRPEIGLKAMIKKTGLHLFFMKFIPSKNRRSLGLWFHWWLGNQATVHEHQIHQEYLDWVLQTPSEHPWLEEGTGWSLGGRPSFWWGLSEERYGQSSFQPMAKRKKKIGCHWIETVKCQIMMAHLPCGLLWIDVVDELIREGIKVFVVCLGFGQSASHTNG